ncbi:MAG: hypothetical protein OXH51_16590 [Gemmatimonadetes bacterium]|nr:hypothetical protein [Gemmatimonadota bacterium]
MRANKSLRYSVTRLGRASKGGWAALSAALLLTGCELTDVQVEPVPDVIVAGVTVVATIDPLDPSRIDTRATALITRFHRQQERLVPGASVRIVGESGRTLDLAEESDPLTTCITPYPYPGGTRPPAGSCYFAAKLEAWFAPGERLKLLVTLPDGGVLTGESRMPGLFAPSNISLENGRCRLNPDTGYRFEWPPSEGSWAYIAEARFAGLGELWSSENPLHLVVTLRGAAATEVTFPRGFLFEALDDLRADDLYRALREGLPEGAGAKVAIGAVDRNWANWTRLGRIETDGEVNIPSVFGDGTGWFGTGVRWNVSVESRGAGGPGDLPLCGPATND